MNKLLAIATVLSLAVSGAALANTTVKSAPVSPVAHSHQITKSHQAKMKSEKKANKGKSAQVSKSTK